MRVVILSLFCVFFMGCAVAPTDSIVENSKNSAELFVMNAPTYAYDGSELKLTSSNSLKCKNCFIYVFEFISAHAGYGDRSGDISAQVVTPHTISVIVQDEKVIQAIVDNTWNELKQREITNYEVVDEQNTKRQMIYYCNDPRPEYCDSESDVVCTGGNKEFENPCLACKQKTTKWYAKGTCQLNAAARAMADIQNGKLSDESAALMVLVS